jgi:integrase
MELPKPIEDLTIIKKENLDQEDSQVISKPIVTRELVIDWKRWFLSQKFSLDTVDMYYSFIKRYVEYKVVINQKTIDRFMENHMSIVSSSALKNFIKFVVYKKHFPEDLLNIRFEKNRQKRKSPKTISPEEVKLIANGMEFLADKLMTKTLYGLALRIEECLKLKWDCFSWQEWLKNKEDYGIVTLEDTKGGKFRKIPVEPELMAELYNSHGKRAEAGMPIGNLMFGDEEKFLEFCANKRAGENLNSDQIKARNRKHYLGVVKQIYRNLLYKVSERTIGKKISPHVLRHSKAQWYMNKKLPIETIQGILGHASIATTQIYAQASPERIKSDLQDLARSEKQIEDMKHGA